jgi:hypothetical protein
VVLVLVSTSQHGVGISPDSTCYISAARSVLAGKGYLNALEAPFVHWPLLFPSILALLGVTGIGPLEGRDSSMPYASDSSFSHPDSSLGRPSDQGPS